MLLPTPLRATAGLAAALIAALIAAPAAAQGFSFSQDDAAARTREQARQQSIADRLSTPCREQLKEKKIMLIIGEQYADGRIAAEQQNYGPHFQAINSRLRQLGLRTYTPEEIRKQIAQAEIDAYFRGNPDAALSASRRLGASFVLRGLIVAEARMNPVIAVNEVTVNMGFSLADARGRLIADAAAQGGSYSGADVRAMALTLVNEQADDVVSRLYADYCTRAGLGEPARRK